jgi:hypothetical protein
MAVAIASVRAMVAPISTPIVWPVAAVRTTLVVVVALCVGDARLVTVVVVLGVRRGRGDDTQGRHQAERGTQANNLSGPHG